MTATQQITASLRSSSAPPILRARGIHKNFKMGDSQVQVIKGADFALRSGEFVAIEGRSGSGKSTLLHILGGLDAVDGGTVEFDGSDFTATSPPKGRFLRSWRLGEWMKILFWLLILFTVVEPACYFLGDDYAWCRRIFIIGLPIYAICAVAFIGTLFEHERRERPRARLRNGQFGFVFQFYYLLPELNVLENTMLAPMIEHSWFGFRSNRARLRERATELLEQLGLSHRLKHRPAHLSGGERQRVAIARALMNRPRILFADEPTGNLDVETGTQIMGVLAKLHRDKGQTIIMVTHDRTIAHQADRVLVLRDGRLQTPAESAEIQQ